MLFWVLSLIVCLLSNASVVEPNAKAQELLKLSAKNGVVNLDDQSDGKFVTEDRTRSYTLMVLFTAIHPKFKCGICKQIDSQFQILADSYAKYIKSEGKEADVFFVRVDYGSASKIFGEYGLTSVPLIYHISPTQGSDGKPQDVDKSDILRSTNDQSVELLASFLKEKTSLSFPIIRPMFWAYVTLFLMLGAVLLAVRPIINSLPFWIGIIQTKGIWIFLSLGVYVCAISGLIFDIIRSPPMYYANPQTGQLMFFYPQSGNQFVVEGFIIGFLNLACGGALTFLATVAPNISPKRRSFGLFASSLIFVFCFIAVLNFFKMKNRWYGAGF
jgi:oligosaccharyltransferase complex subunit gamma